LTDKEIIFRPIGYVHVDVEKVPRHWTLSDVVGELIIEPKYQEGLKDIKEGDRIIVLFHFHKSPPFDLKYLKQKPSHLNRLMGVFSICSPIRPNPIGLSVLEVLEVNGNKLKVRGIDMYNGTPIIDIKPFVVPGASENSPRK